MRITPTTMPTNSGVLVSSVPALAGTGCCLARDPARPSANSSGANRPSSITTPPTMLYQYVFGPRPGEARAVVVGHGRERVHDLGQAMRTRVEYRVHRRDQVAGVGRGR